MPLGAILCAKCGHNTYTGKITRPLVGAAPVPGHVAPTEPAVPADDNNRWWFGVVAAIAIFLMARGFLDWGGGLLGLGSRATITVQYAAPYADDLAGCYSFRNWKKEAWGYSGVMTFHGWKTMGGHPHAIAIEFECRSSSSVILGQGSASFPDLYAGQSGRIELIGNGAAEADRITLRVGGTD